MSGPFRKPTADLAERFAAAVAAVDGLEPRTMFGMPAAFLNGNMTAGIFADSIMVRLSEADRAARLAEGWSLFEPMPGRPMREYVAAPPTVVAAPDALEDLIGQAAAFVRTLPPKLPRPRRSKAAR